MRTLVGNISRRKALRTLASIGLGSQLDIRLQGQDGVQKPMHPTALTACEEESEALYILARRHNPAMAFPNRDMWPVNVAYSWQDGSDLYRETVGGVRQVVLANAELRRRDVFHEAPKASQASDQATNAFYIDVPGDVEPKDAWLERWQAIQGSSEPQAARFAPTQYVHGFWIDQEQGLLGIQYWFFYPYNNWVNRHEGDWEHVTVVLSGPGQLQDPEAFRPATTWFHFHDWVHRPERTLSLTGDDPSERHTVVFVGGQADVWRLWSCQRGQSGGSYPWPGRYSRTGSVYQRLAPSEHIGPAARYLLPEAFHLEFLPEPERLNAEKHTMLWWLNWPLYFGQKRLSDRHSVLQALGLDHPPRHPGWHKNWNEAGGTPVWQDEFVAAGLPSLPGQWTARVL